MKLIWTKERCLEEALKYNSRTEFHNSNKSAYNSSIKNGWMDEICSHMIVIGNIKRRAIYCFEFEDKHVYVGLTYNINKRKNEHLNSDKSAVYLHMNKTGLVPNFKQLTDYIDLESSIEMEGIKIDEYTHNNWIILNRKKYGDVGRDTFKWDYESCKNEALKYNDRTLFMRNSSGAHKSALINGWLIDITEHMNVKILKNYWTKEKCLEEALKYDIKNQFKINSCGAYSFAYRNGFLDEICNHMKIFHKGFRGKNKIK